MRQIIILLSTGLYSGKLPLAPGTWGSLVGLLLFWAISPLPTPAYVATVVVFIAIAVWVSNYAQQIFASEDPKEVVIDEIAGILVTFAFHQFAWVTLIAGFILFRFFDILKPFPVGYIENKFRDGRGIVFDDVMAGVYANISLWIVLWAIRTFLPANLGL